MFSFRWGVRSSVDCAQVEPLIKISMRMPHNDDVGSYVLCFVWPDMHSGYPMMAHLDAADRILDLDMLQSDGDWGVFHEFGHNMQV
jgi:hypothetical protein